MGLGIFAVPERDWGQVPGLDSDVDRRSDKLNPKPISCSEIERIVRQAADTSQNELVFRQRIMQDLYERSVAGPVRRRVLDAAVDYYRSLSVDPAQGRHITQVPRTRERFVIDPNSRPDFDSWRTASLDSYNQPSDFGERKRAQTDISQLRQGVKDRRPFSYGALDPESRGQGPVGNGRSQGLGGDGRSQGPVGKGSMASAALRAVPAGEGRGPGVGSLGPGVGGRGPEMMKAGSEVLPRGANVEDPRAEPVGTRKIWGKRIVEKNPSGKWVVVGHVAGLEDPGKVPQLDLGVLDRENLVHLLHQLIAIRRVHARGAK